MLLFIISSFITHAQTDSTNTPTFKLSVNYNSGLNYFGRTDSLQSSGLFPMAELWFNKELYINAAPIFVRNKVTDLTYAGTVSTIGYMHTTSKWLSHVYLLKPFYKQSSTLVQSALKAQSGASITFLNKALNLTAGADAKLSNQIDVGATGGIDHIFRIQASDKSVIVIDPSVYVYGGTQRFTNTYNKKKKGFLLFPGSNEQVTENVSRFKVLAYEVSIPLIFAKGGVQILATPSYILPQNLITVAGRPDLSEQGKNTLYTTIAVKYSF